MNQSPEQNVSLKDFQDLIRQMYHEKDVARGIPGTFMWFMEEVGELSSALRSLDESSEKRDELALEFADVIAWLTTMANVAEIDLSAAINKKYGSGCPGCNKFICVCDDSEKP